jgi:hypothetical protein
MTIDRRELLTGFGTSAALAWAGRSEAVQPGATQPGAATPATAPAMRSPCGSMSRR